jgi:hypothetical protein
MQYHEADTTTYACVFLCLALSIYVPLKLTSLLCNQLSAGSELKLQTQTRRM